MRIPKKVTLKVDGINNLYGYTIPKGTELIYVGRSDEYYDNAVCRYVSQNGKYFDIHSHNFKTFFNFEENTFGYTKGLKYV